VRARLGAGKPAVAAVLVVIAALLPSAAGAAPTAARRNPYLYTPCESWSAYYGYWTKLEVVNMPCRRAAKVANAVVHWVGTNIADNAGHSHRVGGFTCKLTEYQGEYDPYAIVDCHASNRRRIAFQGAS